MSGLLGTDLTRLFGRLRSVKEGFDGRPADKEDMDATFRQFKQTIPGWTSRLGDLVSASHEALEASFQANGSSNDESALDALVQLTAACQTLAAHATDLARYEDRFFDLMDRWPAVHRSEMAYEFVSEIPDDEDDADEASNDAPSASHEAAKAAGDRTRSGARVFPFRRRRTRSDSEGSTPPNAS